MKILALDLYYLTSLALPWSHWRHRLALRGRLLAVWSGVWIVVAQLGVRCPGRG